MPLPSANDRGCPPVVMLAAFLRAELSPAESESVRLHLAACPNCDSRVNGPTPRTTPAGGHPETVADSAPGANAPGVAAAALPTIGQYQLVEQIGQGGMGVVYRARHRRLKRWVALKLLADRRLTDRRLVGRFEREMEIVGRLDHPNLVRATDAGFADGYHYLAMDLIDGPNLSQLLHRVGDVPAAAVCELVRQAAVGLQHAHEHGLIHRDVKPNNLMVTAAGVVKVLDLGLARLSRAADDDGLTLTWTGAVFGTPDYMAPEQWDSSKTVDVRADVYSLGCTLHTLLAKRPPFAALDSPSRKRGAHLQAPPPRAEEVRPDVPPALQAVIDLALAKDPARRFQTPAEFAAAVEPFARGADLVAVVRGAKPGGGGAATVSYAAAEVETPGPPVGLRPRRRLPRGRWAAVAAVGLTVVAVALAVTFGRSPAPAGVPDPPPPAKPRQNEWFDLLAAEPTKAVWPQGAANADSGWQHDGAKRELWLTVRDRAMLQLTEIEDADFELACTFAQTPLAGNVGLYFGDRPVEDGHEAVSISLSGPSPASMALMLGTISHNGTAFDDQNILGTKPVSRPSTASYRLWLGVYRSGKYKFQWEGQPQLELLPVDRQPRPRATAGDLGLYAQNSTTQIRNLRLRLLPPTP